MRSSLTLASLGAVAAVCLASASPQQAPHPTFRAGVDLVQVDVTVLDKNHRPVRGLTAADFTIVEDGKPQTVAAFSPVDVPDPAPAPMVAGKPVTWMRDVSSDVQSNDVAAGRLVILLIDDALIPTDPRIVANAKKITHEIVDRLGPGDRMSVIFSEGSRQAQDFTSDHARLQAAVEKMHPGRALWTFGWESIMSRNTMMELDPLHNPHPGPDPDIGVRDASFATLQMVGDALLSSPERRKALIYVSPGLPVNTAISSGEMRSGGRGGVSTMAGREANIRLAEALPELFRRMQRANITVYAIDPAGPMGMANYVAGRIDAIPQMHEYTRGAPFDPGTGASSEIGGCDNHAAPGAEIIPACYVPEAHDLASFMTNYGRDFLMTAASNTGGRAIIGTEDYVPLISEVFQETGSYYLLGYRAPAGDKPGDLHRLKITVNRPGVEVHTRSGYYTPKPETTDQRKAISPAAKAAAGVLPSSDVALKVALAPIAVPGKREADVLIVLGLEMPAQDKPFSDMVQVETRAFTPDGEPRGSQVQQAYIGVRPSPAIDIVRYEALSSIALKPGRYQLRIGAYSGMRDAAGSVFADIEVPDFAKDPLSLSGILISATPAVPASPVDLFAKIVPVVPTAGRVFEKLDRVSAFARVYLGGRPNAGDTPAGVTMRSRLMNDRGEIVFDKSATVPPASFGGSPRAADYRIELPLMPLTHGPYLLTISATNGGADVQRQVRFEVK